MGLSITNHVKNNFKGSSINEIKESIVSSFEEDDEITLPGLGVLFKLLWNGSDEEFHDKILETLKKEL